MVVKLLVDTSVWLDLAKDYREEPVIGALADLARTHEIELIVPQIVLDEFKRNKDRIAADAQRGLQTHFRLVREAVNRFGDETKKADTLDALNEIDHKIFISGEAANESIARIEKLMRSVPALPVTDLIKRRVTERALANKAPYHRAKNSVGDAILIETYAELIAFDGGTHNLAFLTHNTKDFGELNGDRRKPHADIAPLFEIPKSRYWTSMVDLIRWVDPVLLADHDSEFNYSQQPRRLSEILEAENLLFRQVWYNRHWNLRISIEEGKHHVVPEKDYSRNPYRSDQTLDTVWAAALAAANKTENEVGIENLGPWDDFEWGMINGKLSALRWVLGDDWDMLDT